jgi:anti-sigma factor RsiW
MTLDHDEAAELLGAYALDAVDGDEATAIEAHLVDCDECRVELDEHRAVVAWIAGGDEESRRRVWSQTAAAMTSVAPIARVRGPADQRRSRVVRLTGIAAVALLIMGTVALVDVGHRRERRSSNDELADAKAALEVFSDLDAQRVQLRSDDGRIALQAAIRPDGTGVVVADSLPSLPQDRTYQLWMITDAGAVSSGLLGARPGILPITVLDPSASALAVTTEGAGGASAPTLPAVVSGALPPN